MYEYLSDILMKLKISPEDVMLIRHVDKVDEDGERRFRKAKEAGFIKEYTAMQAEGFAKDKDYLMVFLKGPSTTARFYALYYIANRFPTRKGHVPEAYPNKKEVEEPGEYLELREVPLPPGVNGFAIDWGRSTRAWKQRATIEKPIIEIE